MKETKTQVLSLNAYRYLMEKLQKPSSSLALQIHNYVANKEGKSSRFVATAQYVSPCPCESFYRAVHIFISFVRFHYLYIIT